MRSTVVCGSGFESRIGVLLRGRNGDVVSTDALAHGAEEGRLGSQGRLRGFGIVVGSVFRLHGSTRQNAVQLLLTVRFFRFQFVCGGVVLNRIYNGNRNRWFAYGSILRPTLKMSEPVA